MPTREHHDTEKQSKRHILKKTPAAFARRGEVSSGSGSLGLISSTAVSARTLAVTMLIFCFSCLGWNFCFKRRLASSGYPISQTVSVCHADDPPLR